MARRKSGNLPPIQSREELTALLRKFASDASDIEILKAERAAEIADIDSRYDDLKEPIEAKMKTAYDRVKLYFAEHGKEITGRNRSTVLAGCRLGMRLGAERVTHKGLKVDEAVAVLVAANWGDDLTSVKRSLDKNAILKMLNSDHAAQLKALGFDIAQSDEFFIDPDAAAKPDVAGIAA